MSKTPLDIADFPPDVRAFVAARAAELAGLKREVLGLSLSHTAAQKRLKDETEATLSSERAPMPGPSRAERP